MNLAINNNAIPDVPIDVVPDDQFYGTKADGSWRGYAAGTPTEQKRQDDAAALADALKLQETKREYDDSMDPNNWQNQLTIAKTNAEIAASNRSGSGGGSGLTAYQQYEIMQNQADSADKTRQWIISEADKRAQNDSRLAGQTIDGVGPDGLATKVTTQAGQPTGGQYYTSAQLTDAHLRDLINQYGLKLSDFGLQPLDQSAGW
jgi:hypothetical protein